MRKREMGGYSPLICARTPQPKRSTETIIGNSHRPPPLDSLRMISASRNKLLATLPSPGFHFTPNLQEQRNLRGQCATSPTKRNSQEGQVPDFSPETPKAVRPGIDNLLPHRASRDNDYPAIVVKPKLSNTFRVPLDKADKRSYAPFEKPASVYVIKQKDAELRRGKLGQSEAGGRRGDSVEQGVIPSNPSVQQETGQRFHSEESEKRQIITELSDYTGETIGNNDADPDRLNTEQINEGVTYANGGVGIRMRSCAKNDYYKERLKLSMQPIEEQTPKHMPQQPPQSAYHGFVNVPKRSSNKRILLRDLCKLQEEVMERRKRMSREENAGGIYNDVPETVYRNFYTSRGPPRNDPLSDLRLPRAPNNDGRRGSVYSRNVQTRHLTEQKASRNDTERSATITCEDAPQLKRMEEVALERGTEYSTGYCCCGSKRQESPMCTIQ